MYADPGSFHRTDQGIVAHSARKRNFIPVAKHSVAYEILGPVSYAFKVFGLVAHAILPTSVPWRQSSTQYQLHETRSPQARHPRQPVA